MPHIVIPDTIDQAAAEKLLRDLATRSNSDSSTIDALKEANQRLEERLASVGRANGSDAELTARYVLPGGMVLLRGVERRHDGTTVPLAYREDDEERPSIVVHGYLDDDPRDDLQREMQRAVSRRNIARVIAHGRNVRNNEPHAPLATPTHDSEIRRLGSYLPEPLARTFNGGTGTGSEWIPSDIYPELSLALSQAEARMVPGLFREISVQRSGTIPLLTAGFLPYIQSAPGADPARLLTSDAATSSATVALKTLAAMTIVGEDASEEAVFSALDIFTTRMAFAAASVEEDAIINGQASTTSVDTGLATWNPDSFWPVAPGGASNDHRKAWNGLRHIAIDASKATDRSTFSFASWGADLGSLQGPDLGAAFIGSKRGLWKNFHTLDQVATAEKLGAAATVLAGPQRQVAGVNIVHSQFMSNAMTAAGIYDGVTMTKTGALHVALAAYLRASRYGVRVFSQVDATRGVIYLGIKTRRDFVQVSTGGVAYSYNMAI